MEENSNGDDEMSGFHYFTIPIPFLSQKSEPKIPVSLKHSQSLPSKSVLLLIDHQALTTSDDPSLSALQELFLKHQLTFHVLELLVESEETKEWLLELDPSLNINAFKTELCPVRGTNQARSMMLTADILKRSIGGVFIVPSGVDDFHLHHHYENIIRACIISEIPLALNMASMDCILGSWARENTAYLIFNPVAGQGDPQEELKLIYDILGPHYHIRTLITKAEENPRDLLNRVLNMIGNEKQTDPNVAEKTVIIASGGDGTVSAIGADLVNSGLALGILPRGTANAFAAALGIPSDLKEACETILYGRLDSIDTARCVLDSDPQNDILMLTLAGIGYEAEMVEKANREMKDKFGVLAYLFAGAQQLMQQQAFNVDVELDNGKKHRFRPAFFTIANAAPASSIYAMGFGSTDFTDDLLDVTMGVFQLEDSSIAEMEHSQVTEEVSPRDETKQPEIVSDINAQDDSNSFNLAKQVEALGVMTKLFTSGLVQTQIDQENTLCMRVKKIRLTAYPPQKICVDGEMVGKTPIEVESLPKSLLVYRPYNPE